MIHLIWSMINGIIVLYFFYIIIGYIVKGNKIFKPRLKVVSIFLILIGIVQIISTIDSKNKSNKILINKSYNIKNNSEIKQVILEENLTFDINMIVKYSIEQDQYIPIESNSFLTGLIVGYVWEFNSINTNKLKTNGKSEFNAVGNLKWNIFGINVYNESKIFNGTIE